MEIDARHMAFTILEAGQKNKTTLDSAIDTAGNQLDQLSPQDRSLCNAIVFGVLRHRGRLDHLIRAFSKLDIDRLDSQVKTILHIGLFQLVFLDRVPDFAAINTSVELAKKLSGKQVNKKTRGYINAVLRQAADRYKAVDLPDKKKQFAAYLQVAYSIPTWLGKRWTGIYGRSKTVDISKAVLEIPPITLRVNTMKTSAVDLSAALNAEGIDTRAAEFSPLGLHISSPGKSPAELPGFDLGHFQVQDEAAQLVVQALAPKPGDQVLDACAGLGGKTCHIGQLMENKGGITAVDIEQGKLESLETEAKRLGLTNINTAAVDIMKSTVKDFHGYFDRVLVDAPCTGLGVMRRNPDTRWKRTRKDILRMAARQKKILNASANLVAPGGILVYAVCSCEPEENENVIRHFLGKRKDYEADAAGFIRNMPGLSLNPDDAFKTYPDYVRMDGFFTARLKRKKTP
jgi:16S rRNA (cytosine967-C5)-methyltransferase